MKSLAISSLTFISKVLTFESSCLDGHVDLKKMEERKHQNGFRKKKKVRYLLVESVVTFEIGDSEEVCVKISSSAPPSKF